MKIKILLFLSTFALLQTANAQTKVGLRAGTNCSSLNVKDGAGQKRATQSVSGVQVGLTADIPLFGRFYVQPGLLYANRGFKEEMSSTLGYGVNFEVKANYVELNKFKLN